MSDATPQTKPKLLVILGAGSSTELKMPSMRDLDHMMGEWARDQAAKAGKPNYFGLLWENRRLYAKRAPERDISAVEHTEPNYERCLGDMLALLNAVLAEPYADPLEFALLSTEFLRAHGFVRSNATASEVYDQFADLVERLAEHFRARCSEFETPVSPECREFARYKQLMLTLEDCFNLGIYNLNHDTVALTALQRPDVDLYFNGFFEGVFCPAAVHRRSEWRFLYHLHGSVHQSFMDGDVLDLWDSPVYWRQSLAGGFNCISKRPFAPLRRGNDGRFLVHTSLVAGGWKLGQLQIDPYQTFYSTLARHAHEADAILIAGYSFGDQHVNAVIRNALGARPKNRPSVMVLDFDGRRVVDEDGRVIEDRLLWERRDSWPHALVGALALKERGLARFRQVESLWIDAKTASPCIPQAVNQFEVWLDPEPVAIWFGGMLAAAERKDEIANWLLRHVPAR